MQEQSQAGKILTSSEKFHIELGLKRISKILKLLDNPEKDLKIIHIAGSNGKGSTCAILEEIFVQAGYKTGKFTSPHLFSYTERITINKKPISDDDFDVIVDKISKIDCKENIGLTEFEILTAAGFLYFKENACDIVILEVGLGGRLDSTNVIDNPLVSVITSISLEHKERLGNTVEKIAFEKAGIIKKGCPIVFLKENKAYKTLKNEAQRLNGIVYESKTIEINKGYALIDGANVEFNLKGKHQGENLALALKTVEIFNNIYVNQNHTDKTASRAVFNNVIEFKTIKKALKSVSWKFRLEEIKFNGAKILVDACHNPDGARILADYLNENYKDKKIKLIFGCLKNKEYREVLGYLLANDAHTFLPHSEIFNPEKCKNRELCFYEFNYPNALKYDELPEEIRQIARKIENPLSEIDACGDNLIVVCGSIYMLGQLFKGF